MHILDIQTIAQGLAMSSYETSIPKIYSSGKFKVVKDDGSHLDNVKTWEDFDQPETGIKASVTKALEEFAVSHQTQIDDNLEMGSTVYNVATLSLSVSVAVCEEFLKFWEEFVRSLTKSKFSNVKAHHVTTRLVRRIFEEIFIPRQGVLKTFKAGNMRQICAAILWTTLQSLQSAQELKKVGFKNLDIVTLELTKFLLINTGYESVKRLESKVKELEDAKRSQQSDVKSAVSSANTASNLASETKKLLAALDKRVKKLEG